MITEIESHEAIRHWTFMKKSELNNKHKNKYRKIKNILSIWYFNPKRFPGGKLMKHKSKLYSRGGMQQWVVGYWEIYAPLVN